MSAFSKYTLAAAASTSNNTHTGVQVTEDITVQIGVEFNVEAVGATPTVTYALQGSFDGTNYDTTGIMLIPSNSETAAATRVVTATGYYHSFVAQAHSRGWRYFRLVTTSNTNVTYSASLYVATLES